MEIHKILKTDISSSVLEPGYGRDSGAKVTNSGLRTTSAECHLICVHYHIRSETLCFMHLISFDNKIIILTLMEIWGFGSFGSPISGLVPEVLAMEINLAPGYPGCQEFLPD